MEEKIKKEIDKIEKKNDAMYWALFIIICLMMIITDNKKLILLSVPIFIYRAFNRIVLANLWCKVGEIFFYERFKEFEICHSIESEEKQ